jgi:predicted component of type VI protein secretion system
MRHLERLLIDRLVKLGIRHLVKLVLKHLVKLVMRHLERLLIDRLAHEQRSCRPCYSYGAGKKTVVMHSDGSSNNTLEISLNRLSGAGCAA